MKHVCNENCVIDQAKISELIEEISELDEYMETLTAKCDRIRPVAVLISAAYDLLEDMQEEADEEEPEEVEPPAELFGYIAHKLQHGHCDLTLKYTKEWLCKNMPGHAADVLRWLEKHGAMCDCEVLLTAAKYD